MKKLVFILSLLIITSNAVFAVDHSAHTAKKDAGQYQAKSGEGMKKMSCMSKDKDKNNLLHLSKMAIEDIVEEQILPQLKGFTLVKIEKNEHDFDVYLKDNSSNQFKITIGGHLPVSGLQIVK